MTITRKVYEDFSFGYPVQDTMETQITDYVNSCQYNYSLRPGSFSAIFSKLSKERKVISSYITVDNEEEGFSTEKYETKGGFGDRITFIKGAHERREILIVQEYVEPKDIRNVWTNYLKKL